jgi:hypothetical protein
MTDVELIRRCALLEKDLAIETDRSKRWQELAGRYDDIRYSLRNCDDTPEGHAEFYRDCCLTIFGVYRDETDEDDNEEKAE